MALTNASLPAKRRILTVCVKLFLEQGYKKTTVAQIVQGAEVSNSSFQNIFRAKDGVLTELVTFMFPASSGRPAAWSAASCRRCSCTRRRRPSS